MALMERVEGSVIQKVEDTVTEQEENSLKVAAMEMLWASSLGEKMG